VKPVVAQLYKKISRIGVFETSALVLIAERETPTSTYRDYFLAFNFDLKSGKKVPLEKGFMVWEVQEASSVRIFEDDRHRLYLS